LVTDSLANTLLERFLAHLLVEIAVLVLDGQKELDIVDRILQRGLELLPAAICFPITAAAIAAIAAATTPPMAEMIED